MKSLNRGGDSIRPDSRRIAHLNKQEVLQESRCKMTQVLWNASN